MDLICITEAIKLARNITQKILQLPIFHTLFNMVESKYMPFHARLLGRVRMALFSFIHSLNTNFGTSIFEPISAFLGTKYFKSVETQIKAGEYITKKAQDYIQIIIDNLTSAILPPNSYAEIEMLRKV